MQKLLIIVFLLITKIVFAQSDYCIPTSDCSFNMIISNVTFNTINRSSLCDAGKGYSFYNTIPFTTTVAKGNTYILSVTIGATFPVGAVAWIDYNQNKTFELSEMLFTDSTGANPATYTRTITIPATALTGITRLRVRSIYNANPGNNPCGNVSFGETEDYLVTINTLPCTPPAINITADTTSCDSVTLTASGGFSYIWNGGSTPSSSTNTFYSAGKNIATKGTYAVQGTNTSGCTSTASKIFAINQCNYCIPGSNCGSVDIINVTFNTINRSSGCDGIANTGYSFYNTVPNTTTVAKGNSYILSVTMGPSNRQGAAAWIDYNQNKIFEAEEMLFSSYGIMRLYRQENILLLLLLQTTKAFKPPLLQ